MSNTVEDIVLSMLIYDSEYAAKVIPFLKDPYFTSEHTRYIFGCISTYINEYKSIPTTEALRVIINEDRPPEHLHGRSMEYINTMHQPDVEVAWAIDETEKFCRVRAAINAVEKAIEIIGEDKDQKLDELPDLLRDAVSVKFDVDIGHDWIDDALSRYEYYKERVYKIPFPVKILNDITSGGVEKKTLNVIAAGTGGGKSIYLADLAYHYSKLGLNVVYFTLEMDERRIAQRLDANAMNVPIQDVRNLNEVQFLNRLTTLKETVTGKVKIKELPTAQANTNHLIHYLKEVEIQDNFVPDVIIVDYLTILTSVRMGRNDGLYQSGKMVAEELLGLAKMYDVPVMTAAQLTRGGQNNSDVGLEEVGESHAISQTCDCMFALMGSPELDSMKRVRIKTLKNRYGVNGRTVGVGLDKEFMRFFDVSEEGDVIGAENAPAQNKLAQKPQVNNFNFNKLKTGK